MKINSKSRTGIILILIGVFLIIAQFDAINEYFILPAVAVGLFALYLIKGGKRHYGNIGLLIPAFILPVIQLQDFLDDKAVINDLEGTLFFALIGLSFLLVYVVHSYWFKSASFGARNWPLITGGGLILFSGFIFMAEYMESEAVEFVLNNMWPVILIIAGLFMLFKNVGKNKVGK